MIKSSKQVSVIYSANICKISKLLVLFASDTFLTIPAISFSSAVNPNKSILHTYVKIITLRYKNPIKF